MESGIQQLEIAPGLKESLLRAGLTVESIVLEGPDSVSVALGIESYVAKIIYDAAKKIVTENSMVAS
ncbi:MAG TPA: hypothetical protein VEP90_09815 [Methylomirabilota bacterium]|nr:hypothetical protein [Methylomirabilota bacterium]